MTDPAVTTPLAALSEAMEPATKHPRAILAALDEQGWILVRKGEPWPAPASGWRPIEMAPKKLSEFVDLWVEYRTVVNGEPYEFKAERYALARWVDWSTGVGRWIDAGGNDIEWRDEETDDGDTILRERKVTHWQPLPAGPGHRPKAELRADREKS